MLRQVSRQRHVFARPHLYIQQQIRHIVFQVIHIVCNHAKRIRIVHVINFTMLIVVVKRRVIGLKRSLKSARLNQSIQNYGQKIFYNTHG